MDISQSTTAATLVGRFERDEHVVQSQVTVDQGAIGRLRQIRLQPLHQLVVAGHLAGVGQLPLPLPARELPGHVALRAPEAGQSDGADVDRVDRREHVDRELGQLPGLAGAHLGAVFPGPQHLAGDVAA